MTRSQLEYLYFDYALDYTDLDTAADYLPYINDLEGFLLTNGVDLNIEGRAA